jgi:uncharacterized protein YggL (DUF469 family)
MPKVSTHEDRINPNRKRRLRKKLHVSEFKETGMELMIMGLSSSDDDDDKIDEFLDTLERVGKQYGWKSGYVLFSNEFSSILYININEIALQENGGVDNFIDDLIKESEYNITVEHVEDAHYPDEDVYY